MKYLAILLVLVLAFACDTATPEPEYRPQSHAMALGQIGPDCRIGAIVTVQDYSGIVPEHIWLAYYLDHPKIMVWDSDRHAATDHVIKLCLSNF